MRYIYTSDGCNRCVELKARYKTEGIEYEERAASRMKSPEDEADREALVQASMRNMELPVEVEV